MAIGNYESTANVPLLGPMIDIKRIEKWLKNEKIYNYQSFNILQSKDKKNGFIFYNNVIQWLTDAATDIRLNCNIETNNNQIFFDGLIFYVSCHATINHGIFKYVFLFFFFVFCFVFVCICVVFV